MRVFKSAWFGRFSRKQCLSDIDLLVAVHRAEQGLIDADLGSGVVKQRVARKGQGKSGGYRAIIFYRAAQRAFFVYGYAKSSQANISDDEVSKVVQESRPLCSRAVGRAIGSADRERPIFGGT